MWRDGEEVFGLPSGPEVKVLFVDKEQNRIDTLLRFPPGYHEPRHSHTGDHSCLILDGTQIVANTYRLGPGDFLYGPSDVPHGPFDTPTAARCS